MQLATAEADGSALTIETAELTAQLNQARRQAQEAQDEPKRSDRPKKPSGGRGAPDAAQGSVAGRMNLSPFLFFCIRIAFQRSKAVHIRTAATFNRDFPCTLSTTPASATRNRAEQRRPGFIVAGFVAPAVTGQLPTAGTPW